MKFNHLKTLALTSATASLAIALSINSASAAVLTVDGTDAIYLAGRTDVTIPPLGGSNPTFPLARHGFVGAGFLQETFPDFIAATAGQVFSFNATGGIDYYNDPSANFFGPDGGPGNSSLLSLGGISGYNGLVGSLVGLFLDNSIPSGSAPSALDFANIGAAFTNLAPGLGQVFFIGDGLTGTGSGTVQTFAAPTGATRLFLGIADGFSFSGTPGAYEDNNGAFRVTVTTVPEPATVTGLLVLGGLVGLSRRRRQQA